MERAEGRMECTKQQSKINWMAANTYKPGANKDLKFVSCLLPTNTVNL